MFEIRGGTDRQINTQTEIPTYRQLNQPKGQFHENSFIFKYIYWDFETNTAHVTHHFPCFTKVICVPFMY